MRLPEPEQARQTPWGTWLAFAFAAGGIAVGIRTCAAAPKTTTPEDVLAQAASSAMPSEPLEPPKALPLPPRCAELAPGTAFTIGEAPAPRPVSAPPPSQGAPGAAPLPAAPDEPEEDPLAPFAVEIGRGTVFDGGFAAGTLRDAEGGSVAMVATLGFDGKNGKLVRLARSRGDLDPPVVAAAGASLFTALLEPNASGRAIKIAKVTGEEVTWGVELSEGRDESLALDIAVAGARGVIVWDDVSRDAKRSSVVLASFDTGSLRSVTQPRPVSPPAIDADSPRIVARPGGYWLAYVARAGGDEDESPVPRARKKVGKSDPSKPNEDTAAAGEAIGRQWLEVMPLDESGAATSTPRAITPKDGHVLAFDLEPSEDGSAIVAWRDDDTPQGSSGGRVSAVFVGRSGEGEPHVLAEEGVGAGVPELLPGWLSVASLSGPAQLARMTARGEMVGALAPEPSLGSGEPIAGTKDVLLVARPAGRAMKLSLMRCAPVAP